MEKTKEIFQKKPNQLSTTNISKELFELLQSEKNNFKEEKNSYGLTRIIIPENIVDKIKNTLNTQKLTNNQKELLKKLIKKSLILHNQSAIVFWKWKIFIIPKKVDEKRFHGLAPEDIELILHEFIKWINTDYIIQEVLNNIDFSTYNPNQIKDFIEWDYKRILLNIYKKVLKKLIKSDINDEILEWIAWKLFRENFQKTVKKVIEKLIIHLTITQKDQIIQDILEKNLADFDFNNTNIDFFQINENLTKNIFNQVKEKINHIIQQKTNTIINKEWMGNNYIIQITKSILKKIFQKLIERIFTLLEQNPSDTQIYKSLDNFFSYYSWKIEIKWMRKFQYPKLEISHINKWEKYQNRFESYSYKYILNQLITYIKKKKQLKKDLKIINNKIKNLIESQTQLNEEKKKIEIKLNKTRWDLKTLNQKISQLELQKEKIQKELDKISQQEKKSKLNKLKSIFSTDKSKLKEDLQKINKELNSVKIQKQTLSRKISNLETKIDSLKANITNLKKLENEKIFYEKQLDKIQQILQDIQKELEKQLQNRKQLI